MTLAMNEVTLKVEGAATAQVKQASIADMNR
jgi:hypothetical protein